MHFLPPVNESVPSVWFDDGLNPGFSDSISWLTTALLFYVPALIENLIYRRYTSLRPTGIPERLRTKLFLFHMLCHVLLAILALSALFVYAYCIQDGEYYGYQIMVALLKG